MYIYIYLLALACSFGGMNMERFFCCILYVRVGGFFSTPKRRRSPQLRWAPPPGGNPDKPATSKSPFWPTKSPTKWRNEWLFVVPRNHVTGTPPEVKIFPPEFLVPNFFDWWLFSSFEKTPNHEILSEGWFLSPGMNSSKVQKMV